MRVIDLLLVLVPASVSLLRPKINIVNAERAHWVCENRARIVDGRRAGQPVKRCGYGNATRVVRAAHQSHV